MKEIINPHLEEFLRDVEDHKVDLAAIYELIDIYYYQVVYTAPESDDDLEDVPFSKELKKPLEERDSGIIVAMTRLLDSGHDANESYGSFNAMMLAVGNGDAPMVRFLIEHGADVTTWPDMDEEPERMRQNYYLEDIDIHFMDECLANVKDSEYIKALHQTALVLAKCGRLGPYTGHCLAIDAAGNVSLKPPRLTVGKKLPDIVGETIRSVKAYGASFSTEGASYKYLFDGPILIKTENGKLFTLFGTSIDEVEESRRSEYLAYLRWRFEDPGSMPEAKDQKAFHALCGHKIVDVYYDERGILEIELDDHITIESFDGVLEEFSAINLLERFGK